MDRVDNWSCKIVEDVGSLAGSPFVWGETDCCTLLRKLYKSMFDDDTFGGPFQYTTAKGAIRAYKNIESIDKVILEWGGVEIPVRIASDGDVAVEQEVYKGFQNVSIKVGSRWLMSSEESSVVEVLKAIPDRNMKVYRF